MNYLILLFLSVLIIFILVMVLLSNSKSSNNIHIKADMLTIRHPLKKEVINLESDLKSWNIQRINMLWWGKLYSVNLELQSGKWTKIYSRFLSGKIEQLLIYLEETASGKKTGSLNK